MGKATLIPAGLPLVPIAQITCFHGHTEKCLFLQLKLTCGGQDHLVAVTQVKTLPYDFLFGWDSP